MEKDLIALIEKAIKKGGGTIYQNGSKNKLVLTREMQKKQKRILVKTTNKVE